MIHVTIGGDAAWLAAIGIGGSGFTSAAGWFATRPPAPPASAPPLPPAGARRLTEDEPGRDTESYDLLEALPLAVLVVDRRRDIRAANGPARQLLGEGLAGRSLLGVLRHPPLIDALDQAISGQGEAAAPSGAGIEVPMERGRLLVAEIKRLGSERTLIALKDTSAERRLERLRSDFIANVSHELKTPVSTLIGFIETLRGPARDDADARERFLAIMQEQAARMSRLVADLLSLSRIELNEHARPSGEADLDAILGRVADALSLRAAERGMTIDLPAQPVGRITGDAEELTQVFQNLIDNAIKYGRTGTAVAIAARRITDPAEIRARLPALRRARAMVAVSVADRGEGIAREHLPRLTERFYRVDAARSRELGGTGLGLAIVKHVVNRHRGSLEIDSMPGEGSVFTVYLPIEESADPTPAPNQPI